MRHLIIPDCQVRPGDDLQFLRCIGNYIVEKKPEKVICLGDFADMPSLSSYDVGKKSFEGRRYTADIHAARAGMETLIGPIKEYNRRMRKTKHSQYIPDLKLLLGNHEHRIERAVENDAKLEGLLSTDDLGFEDWGWDVFPFLQVVVLDGVAYSHYFTTGVAGRPASSAAAQLRRTNMSAIAGHQQGLQIHTGYHADGRRITNIIAGSCYETPHDYLGPQGNVHWNGILMLHEVANGEFDLMPISLKYLKNKYA